MIRTLATLTIFALAFALAVCGPADAQQPGTHGQQPGAAQHAADVPDKPVLCPVTQKPVDWDQVTRFRGKWVYFANADALEKFNEDPYSYADGVLAQWQANQPLRVQVKCPVTGDPPAGDIYVGKGVDAVFFATKDAKAKWEKDSAPFKKRLAQECYTFQTGCATCGMEINPAVRARERSQVLYFCCSGCRNRLNQNKGEHLRRVAEQMAANKAAWEQRHGKADDRNKPAKGDEDQEQERKQEIKSGGRKG